MTSCCEFHKNNCSFNCCDLDGILSCHSKERIEYTNKLLALLEARIIPGPQTYGFEYEFISTAPLDLEIMKKIYAFLPETGFTKEQNSFVHESGMYIDFEPGGQIEFHSPPMLKNENLDKYLNRIKDVTEAIKTNLGIEYIAAGYMPGRKNSPLCLDAERYINLHNRLAVSSTRGLEMMKGTASIHFHAGIKNIDSFPEIFSRLIRMAESDDFKMGKDRRSIWDNTDPNRCGQPFNIDEYDTTFEALEKITDYAIIAEHIGENRPFIDTEDLSFDAFMYHMTTIFTDIRINVKGPSLELRTLDSVPFEEFKNKWNKFIGAIENKTLVEKGA